MHEQQAALEIGEKDHLVKEAGFTGQELRWRVKEAGESRR